MTGIQLVVAGGLSGIVVMLAAYAMDHVCWRSPALNLHPGLYVRFSGKWYRIVRAR